jgi:hypothetical protein
MKRCIAMVALPAAVGAGFGLAGCAQGSGDAARLQVARAGAVAAQVLDSSLAPAVRKADLSAPAIDATFDPTGRYLWVLTQADSTGPNELNLLRITIGTGASADVKMPSAVQDSVTDHVRTDPQGGVWVSGGYGLTRVDGVTLTVSSVTLPLAVPGSLPAADDPSSPTAGTWISAIAPTADGAVLVDRENVPFITEFDASLVQSHTWPSPPSLVGATDMAMGSAGLTSLAVDGAPEPPVDLGLPRSAGTTSDNSWMRVPRGSIGTETELQARTIGGGNISLDDLRGVLTWSTGPTAAIKQAQLPMLPITIAGPDGAQSRVLDRPSISTAVLDPSGNLWFGATWHGRSSVYELPAG